jgi:hypothetical protein
MVPLTTLCLAILLSAVFVFVASSILHRLLPYHRSDYRQLPDEDRTVGFMTVAPNGPPAMPKFLIQWFVFCLLIGFFVAYLTGHTVASGATYREVFRVGIAAFLAYGLGQLSNGIWKCQTWSSTIKEVCDGLVYRLLTAGTFGLLWRR